MPSVMSMRTRLADWRARAGTARGPRSRAIPNADAPVAQLFEALEARALFSTVFWDGGPSGTGTDWHTAANWAGDVLPAPGDDVVLNLPAGPTVVLNQSESVNSVTSSQPLTVSGTLTVAAASQFNAGVTLSGTLTGAGDATFSAGLSWTGGTMSGAGTTIIAATTGTLSMSVNTHTLSRTLRNDGAATWTVGTLSMNGGTFTNNGSFTFNSASNFNCSGVAGSNSFANVGSFVKQGAGTLAFSAGASGVRFNSDGTADVQGGTLALDAGGTSTGSFTTASGTTLRFNGTHALSATSSITAAGALTVAGGTLTEAGAVSVGGTATFSSGTATFGGSASLGSLTVSGGTVNFNGSLAEAAGAVLTLSSGTANLGASSVSFASGAFSGGTLTGAGDVTITGALSWTGGTMSGAGTTIVAATTGTLSMSGGSHLLNRVLRNDGAATWTVGTLSMNGGTFTSNGSFTANSASTLDCFGAGGTNAFVNNGTLVKQGAGSATFRVSTTAAAFSNAGSVDVQVGTLTLSGGGTNSGAIVVEATGAVTATANFAYGASSSLSGAGAVTFSGGTHTFPAGAFTPTGTVNFSSATVTVNNTFSPTALGTIAGTVTFNAAVNYAGALTITGTAGFGAPQTFSALTINASGLADALIGSADVAITGTLSWLSGNIAGGAGAKVIVAPGATATISGGTHRLKRTFQNDGTVTWTSGSLDIYTASTFVNNGVVNATVASGTINADPAGGANTFLNNGTLNKTGAGTLRFSAITGTLAFNSAGSVSVQGGTLQLSSGGTASGNLNVIPGGVLLLDSSYSYAASATVTGAGTLTFNGGTHTFASGQFMPSGAVNFISGTVTVNNAFTPTSLGTIGATCTFNAAVNWGGALTITGGASFAAPQSFSVLTLGALSAVHALDGAGDVTVRTTFNWQSGTIGGAPGSRLIIAPNATASMFTSAGTLLRGMRNDGTLTWTAGNLTISGAGSLTNNGQFNVAIASGTLTIIESGGTSVFTNNGSLVKSGAGQFTFAVTAGGGITLNNAGSVTVQAGTLQIPTGGTSSGVINVNSGTLSLTSGFAFTGMASLQCQPGATVSLAADLSGTTANADLFAPQGTVTFSGASRQLEVMSRDLGATAAGFSHNFAWARLDLTAGSTVTLVDASDNAPGAGAESLYVDTLVVPSGAVLNLSGKHVYVRASQIAGTVNAQGGSIQALSDGGPIVLGSTVAGVIGSAGEADEWTFYGRAGRGVTVIVDPGVNLPPPGSLGWVEVRVLKPDGQPLANGVVNNLSSGLGSVVTLPGLQLSTDGTYRIRVLAPAPQSGSTGRYRLSAYDSSVTVRTLSLGDLQTGAIASPLAVDRWTFGANGSVSNPVPARFDLFTASPGLTFTLIAPDGTHVLEAVSASVPQLSLTQSGQYRLEVQGQNAGVTGAYAMSFTTSALVALSSGVPSPTPFSGTGDAHFFYLDVAQGQTLYVALDDAASLDHNEIYLRLGAPPTRGQYAFSATGPGAGQSLLIPNAAPGRWFIMTYCAGAAQPGTISVRATSAPVRIATVEAGQYPPGSTATLTINGAGFLPGAQVDLLNGVDVIIAQQVRLDSFNRIVATVPIPASAAQGQWTVRVTVPGAGSDSLPGGLTIGAPAAAVSHLETSLIMPANVGRHALATLYIEYANTGGSPMPAPLLRLQATDPATIKPILTLDHSLITKGFWTANLPDGFSTSIQLLASGVTPGILAPGERLRVPVYYAGLLQPWGPSLVSMEIRVFDAASSDPVPWESMRESLRPFTVQPDAWNTIYQNIIVSVGSTWGTFVSMLSDNAQFLSRLGRQVVDVSQLWNYEVQQAVGFNPVRTLESTIDALLVASGADLPFARTFPLAIDQRFNSSLFGRGWAVPWLTHLTEDVDGSVNITGSTGSRRRFQPDVRTLGATFFGLPDDTGTLVRISPGVYELTEQTGDVTRFNVDGAIDYLQDANGNRSTMQYAGGRMVGITHSSGASLAIAYNAAGLVASVTDSAGRTTSYTYDASGEHLLTVTGADGRLTSYTYDTAPGSPSLHALTGITAGGVTHTYSYDNHGRLAGTHLGANSESTAFTYGSAGTVTVTDGAGAATEFDYDNRGLLDRVVDPFGNIATAEYGDDLRIIRMIDPVGHDRRFTWNAGGSLTGVTNELSQTTLFDYEGVGPNGALQRMTSTTDANGNITRFSYDSRGNLLSTTYADETIERVGSFDPMGDPLSFINRRGQTLSYLYDAAGRPTRQTFDDGTSIDFAYDARGNLHTITEPGGGAHVTTFDYDSGDRMLRVTYPNGRFVAFTYDSFGRRATMYDQTGFVVNYSYDDAGRLFRLTDGSDALIVQYTYDAVGRLSRKDNGNGTHTDYTYDLAGQALSIVSRAPGGAIDSRFDYTYDALGRRITQATLDGGWSYGYDDAGRLTHATFAPAQGSPVPAQDLQYTYDALGNRVQTIENGVSTAYTTNTLNQYTHVGGDILVYDADGNLVSRSGPSGNATYAYDQQGRLIRAVTPGGTWVYEYDALGHRTASTFNGQRTEYLLDPSGLVDVVGEYTSAGTLAARYIHGTGLVARVDGGTGARSFYDFDGGGSAADTTDAQGQVLSRYAYRPFGETLWSQGAVPNPFQFSGESGSMIDGSGAQFMRDRFELPSLGRFLTIDPIRLHGGDSNLYSYVLNNPISFVDPRGHEVNTSINPSVSGSVGVFAGLGGTATTSVGDGNICTSLDGGVGLGGGAGVSLNSQAPSSGWNGINLGFSAGPVSGNIGWGPGGLNLGGGIGLGGGADLSLTTGWTWCHPLPQLPNPPGTAGPTPPGNGSGGGGGSSNTANARDPNHLVGPAGFGSQHWVRGDATLPYRIEFENYGPGSLNPDGTPVDSSRWATAPAQQVVITSTISTSLDLSTLLITGFGFGDVNVSIPAPAQSVHQVVSMTLGGHTFEVWFEAGIDFATRQLRFTFQSIDPGTMLPPDVLTGFLPPEDGTGRGQAFADYLIKPTSGLPTGTQVRSTALISFDGQTFIATNQTDPLHPELGTDPDREALVTIDNGNPLSHVLTLGATVLPGRFLVSWSGQDDASPGPTGSGIRSYTIWVSTDGGAYVAWLRDTTRTSFPFLGVAGHTYRFVSQATDNVGNVETLRTVPDTTTTVGALQFTAFPHSPPFGPPPPIMQPPDPDPEPAVWAADWPFLPDARHTRTLPFEFIGASEDGDLVHTATEHPRLDWVDDAPPR